MTEHARSNPRKNIGQHIRRAWHGIGMSRWSVAQYLVALALLIVTSPAVSLLDDAAMIESALFTLAMGFGVAAVGRRRTSFLWAVILLAPALGGRWYHHIDPHALPNWPFLAFTVVFMAFLLVNLLAFILRARHVNGEVLCAGVATYLTIGITFGLLFQLTESLAPGSFYVAPESKWNGGLPSVSLAYFSFITLATVGYGDIVPVSPTARMLAIVESTIGTFYIAIVIARLVSLYQVQKADHN